MEVFLLLKAQQKENSCNLDFMFLLRLLLLRSTGAKLSVHNCQKVIDFSEFSAACRNRSLGNVVLRPPLNVALGVICVDDLMNGVMQRHHATKVTSAVCTVVAQQH